MHSHWFTHWHSDGAVGGREGDRILAYPLGPHCEHPLATEAIENKKDLIPREIGTLEYNLIKQNAW